MPNTLIPHPITNTMHFGELPEMHNRGATIEAGRICLRKGNHFGPNRGFGVEHIWAEHKVALKALGYSDITEVPLYVAHIIVPGASIHCEFNDMRGRHRITILKNSKGMAVLGQQRERGKKMFYSVITAYPKTNAHGTLIGTVR